MFGTTAMLILTLCGCGAASPAPQATGTPVAAHTATAAFTAQPTASQWVPPTALVGTPLPGAVETLTSTPRLKTATLTIENRDRERIEMQVEVADTPEARQLGLMFRSEMAPNAGMLFDFGEDTTGGFWMQNTILPLSIAFILADGTILDIKDMQPLDTSTVGPDGAYRYALETNQGFFEARNISVGDKVTFASTQSMAVLPGMPACIK